MAYFRGDRTTPPLRGERSDCEAIQGGRSDSEPSENASYPTLSQPDDFVERVLRKAVAQGLPGRPFSAEPSMLSILAAVGRSGIVSKSQAMIACSGTSTIPVASNDGNQLQAIQQLPLRSRRPSHSLSSIQLRTPGSPDWAAASSAKSVISSIVINFVAISPSRRIPNFRVAPMGSRT